MVQDFDLGFGFDSAFDLLPPFRVVEHCRLRPDQREDCLSDSEFRSARYKLKRAEQPQANASGRLFFGSFLLPSKEMNSHMKCEKHDKILITHKKENTAQDRQNYQLCASTK